MNAPSPPFRHRDSNTVSPAPAGHWLWQPEQRPWSLLIHRRTLAVNLALTLALIVAAGASLTIGTLPLTIADVVRTLQGQGTAMSGLVIGELRGPRLLAALFTGAAFALAGCLMQTLARNRLATPGIIGIDNAATAFAVASVVGTGISLAPQTMALAGAACATALAFGLAGATGTRGYRFIIAGLAIGAISGAVTQVLLSTVAVDTANAAYPWTVGSLNARSGASVQLLGYGLAAGYLLSLLLGRYLNVLQLPEPVATGLGLHPGRVRLVGLTLSVILTGLAVSVAGPVGMVALIAPELARSLSRPGRVPLTASALAGALLMVLSDLAGRSLLAPLEIPVGLVTTLAGSPCLLWILLRKPPVMNQ